MIGYYDLVLVLIPASLLGLTGAFYGIGLDMTAAVPLAGLAAVGLMAHAMFVNSPIESPESNPRVDRSPSQPPAD